MLFALPTVMLISLSFLPEYTSRTQKVVEIPLIDSVYVIGAKIKICEN